LSKQVDLFEETIEKHLKTNFKTPYELREHLAHSLFMTVIGVNDYAFFYTRLTDANDFADELLHKFLKKIEVKGYSQIIYLRVIMLIKIHPTKDFDFLL